MRSISEMKLVTKTNPDHPAQRYQVTVFIGQDEVVSFTNLASEISRAVAAIKQREQEKLENV